MIYWLVFMSVVIVFMIFHMIPSENNMGRAKTVVFTVVIAVLITSMFAGLNVLFGL